MTATRALDSAREAAIKLGELKLAVECATTLDEIQSGLTAADRLCAELSADVADATGTTEEMAELRHWCGRCEAHLAKARDAGVQSWQLLKGGLR